MSLVDSGNGTSGPLLVLLLRDIMDPLRGGDLLEDMCHLGQALEMYSLPALACNSPALFHSSLKMWTPGFPPQHLVAVPPQPQWTVPSSGTINQHKLFPPEVHLDHGIFIT